jgi:hypothetical protein
MANRESEVQMMIVIMSDGTIKHASGFAAQENGKKIDGALIFAIVTGINQRDFLGK